MTKLPKIYAFCPAGCKWETVHKDDFLQSAALVTVYPNEDGTKSLEMYRKYKIMHDTYIDLFWWFGISVAFTWYPYGEGTPIVDTKSVSLSSPKQYISKHDGLLIRFLDIHVEYDSSANIGSLVLVYDCDGTIMRQTLATAEGGTESAIHIDSIVLKTTVPDGTEDAVHCWYYNENASMTFSGATGMKLTLNASAWVDKKQTVSAMGVSANNIVIVASDPSNMSEYTASGILCTAQGAGTLTFTAAEIPTVDLIVEVVVV